MSTPKKPQKKFLNLPAYPGGKKAFDAFIKENLVYPPEALEHRIEGDVFITYEVNDNGEVLQPALRHGIGYGCDEEALRLVRLLNFPRTTNRGLRVKSRFNTRIPFRLPKKAKTVQVSYQVVPKPAPPPAEPQPAKTGYTWQISLKPKS